jgi:hypothetical protein
MQKDSVSSHAQTSGQFLWIFLFRNLSGHSIPPNSPPPPKLSINTGEVRQLITDRLCLSEILGFRTLSIVLVIKKNTVTNRKTVKKHDVSETGSVSVLR